MNGRQSGTLVYVGTYTHGESEGIYVYEMDRSTGALRPLSVTKGIANPSYLAFSPDYRYLYAVNEIGKFNGRPTGAVNAYEIDRETGELVFLNQQPSEGTAPCHISVDRAGCHLYAANYGAGTVAMFPIEKDGKLGVVSDCMQHEGKGPNTARQEGPHAHSINIDPTDQYAFAADLGIDRIMVYRIDHARGMLTPNDPSFAETHSGAGPRHLAFSPDGRFAFVINELDSTLCAFRYDRERGALSRIQTVSTLPETVRSANHPADVHVAPSGRFLYGSNRGDDSIVIYRIDEALGTLSLVGHESTQGKTPRNFAIDPDGQFLLVANQETNNVVVLRLDADSGILLPTGHTAHVPTPVCVKFAER